jgi:hypothetical protein
MKNAKIHDAERCDPEPVALLRPLDPERERDRQQQEEPDPEPEHAEGHRIACADGKSGGAARNSADGARRKRREHADVFVSHSAHMGMTTRPRMQIATAVDVAPLQRQIIVLARRHLQALVPQHG